MTVQPSEITGDTYLLDVREDDEWEAGHVAGSTHIAMSGLLARIGEVPKDRDVAVVCKSGSRSAQVTAYLRQNGWDSARNLEGGLDAWVRAGKPLVSDSGAPTVL